MTQTDARLVPVKEGWAAVGDGWAVFAPSRSEASQRYQEAERKHREIEARGEASHPPSDARGRRPDTTGP
jgi:endonuclease YncB( thermonuclease family)